MFERYTEQARRSLFFARFETSALGGTSIEPAHLLLGLLREPAGRAVLRLQAAGVAVDELRATLERENTAAEKLGTSVEVPFSIEVEKMLRLAAQEADALLSLAVDDEHLLLGVLTGPWQRAPQLLWARTTLAVEIRRALAPPRGER